MGQVGPGIHSRSVRDILGYPEMSWGVMGQVGPGICSIEVLGTSWNVPRCPGVLEGQVGPGILSGSVQS